MYTVIPKRISKIFTLFSLLINKTLKSYSIKVLIIHSNWRLWNAEPDRRKDISFAMPDQ